MISDDNYFSVGVINTEFRAPGDNYSWTLTPESGFKQFIMWCKAGGIWVIFGVCALFVGLIGFSILRKRNGYSDDNYVVINGGD